MPRPHVLVPMAAAVLALVLAVTAGGAAAQNLPLPALPYAYDALEPYISAEIMRVHHLKHHQTYTDKLNGALQEMRAQPQHKALAKLGIDALLGRLHAVPGHWQDVLRNHGGGYVNHALFWKCMRPPLTQPQSPPTAPTDGTAAPVAVSAPRPDPNTPFHGALVATYGSFDAFQRLFTSAAVNLFGSGWVWLVLTPAEDVVLTASQRAAPRGTARPNDSALALSLVSTQNQDSPLLQGQVPVLALDVWEHAYYLQYKNARASYVDGWWHLVDWQFVAAEYDRALAKANADAAGLQDGATSHDEL